MSLGGEGLPWAISSKSKNADAAATYLDFLTNADADAGAGRDRQPAGDEGDARSRRRGVDTEVYRAWTRRSTTRDAIVPYLDWATPTMYDDVTARPGAASGCSRGIGLEPDASSSSDMQADYRDVRRHGC